MHVLMGTHRLYAALRHPIALPNAFTPHKFLSLFVRTILSHIFMSSFGKLNQSPLPPSPLRSVPQRYRHNGWRSRCGWHSLKGKENTYFCNGIILAVLLSMSGIVAPICLDFQPNLLFYVHLEQCQGNWHVSLETYHVFNLLLFVWFLWWVRIEKGASHVISEL